jgi:peptide deformylase
MALRKIITLPEPVLRRKARVVTTFNKDLQILIDDMIETMREAPGVGLAAPQVNISERLIVVEYAEEKMRMSRKSQEVVCDDQPGDREKLNGALMACRFPSPIWSVKWTSCCDTGKETVTASREGRQGWLAHLQHEIDH